MPQIDRRRKRGPSPQTLYVAPRGFPQYGLSMTSDAAKLARLALPDLFARIARIVARDSEGKVHASATATLLEFDGRRLIATAHHVVGELRAIGLPVSLLVFPERITRASFSVAAEYPLDLDTEIPVKNGPAFDIGFLPAPPDLTGAEHIAWFDAPAQLPAVQFLRDRWQQSSTPFLTLIVGFPSFSRLESRLLRTQIAGNFQTWAYLRRFTDTPAFLVSGAGNSSQIILELDAPGQDVLPADAPPIVHHFVRNFNDATSRGEPAVGGYSGSPLVYVTPAAYHLVGVIKEGDIQLGARAFATPLDAVVRLLRTQKVPFATGP